MSQRKNSQRQNWGQKPFFQSEQWNCFLVRQGFPKGVIPFQMLHISLHFPQELQNLLGFGPILYTYIYKLEVCGPSGARFQSFGKNFRLLGPDFRFLVKISDFRGKNQIFGKDKDNEHLENTLKE